MSRFKDEFREETGVAWRPWRWFFSAIVVGLAVWLVLAVIGWVTQPVRTVGQIRERVGDADNVLFQYEKFHDRCATVVTYDGQRKAADKAAKDYDERTEGKPDPIGRIADESARLHQVADGIGVARLAEAERYNADSRKLSERLFKDRSLPHRITAETPTCDGVG